MPPGDGSLASPGRHLDVSMGCGPFRPREGLSGLSNAHVRWGACCGHFDAPWGPLCPLQDVIWTYLCCVVILGHVRASLASPGRLLDVSLLCGSFRPRGGVSLPSPMPQ